MHVYTIKVALRGVSPMVWRRIRLHGDTSLGALHFIIQFAFGWDNEYLHSFHIYGKDYGISYDCGIGFSDNPWLITLESFKFEPRDRFTYEYNFYRHWFLDIRIERIHEPSKKKTSFCLSGHGMPDATKHDETERTLDLMQAIAELDETTTISDIRMFIEALNRVRFNRHQFNHLLHEQDLTVPNWSQGLA
jgi:hypothetical protein